MKTVKEVSDLTSVSVRTLHYYDQIGLLHPAQVTNSGYRLYGADQMRQLQLILFLKELRILLKEIIQILNSPTFDPNIVLQQHRQLLILQRKQLNALIRYVNQMIKGKCNMPFTAFDQTDINKTRKKYVDEVRTRWGNTSAYAKKQKNIRTAIGKISNQKWRSFFLISQHWLEKKNARTAMKHKNSLLPGKGILRSTTMIVSRKCSPDWGKCTSRTLAFLKIWNNMEKIAPNLQVRQSMFTAKKVKPS